MCVATALPFDGTVVGCRESLVFTTQKRIPGQHLLMIMWLGRGKERAYIYMYRDLDNSFYLPIRCNVRVTYSLHMPRLLFNTTNRAPQRAVPGDHTPMRCTPFQLTLLQVSRRGTALRIFYHTTDYSEQSE